MKPFVSGSSYPIRYLVLTCNQVQVCALTGVLGRGDAKVLLMGGQDDIWDHAAGMLIAQESGLLVTNGAGTPSPQVSYLLHACMANYPAVTRSTCLCFAYQVNFHAACHNISEKVNGMHFRYSKDGVLSVSL